MRILTDGGEMNDLLVFSSTDGTTVVSSPTPRSGSYCYKIFGTSKYAILSFTSVSEQYFRYGLYQTANIPSARFPIIRTGTTNIAYLMANAATSKIEAYIDTSLVGTSTNPINYGTWYLFEIYYKEADADGRFVVKIDGNIEIDYTGDTKPSTGTTYDNYIFSLSSGEFILLDDFGINDTTGTYDNSWCGDGRIIKITPSGSGTYTNFINSDGVSGSSNYLYVDEYPYSSASFVYYSGSSAGTRESYKMSDITGEDKTIIRIYSEGRIKKERADSSSIKLGYLPNGGTVQTSASSSLTLSYARVVGGSAIVNPVSGSAWTADDINALEYVNEIG